MQENIFKDLKIVELASVLAGPSVGMFFAELGAKVIKVENKLTDGDVTRSWKLSAEDASDNVSAYFLSVNWGKEFLLLDLTNETDKQQLYELLKTADIVISSYKPGDDVKLGVDYESVKKQNPQILYGYITGFGNDDFKTGYDAIIQAESGFMYMNGTPQSGPVKMPVALMDILAAHQLKEGLLVALVKKIKTGEGSYVHVSLIKAAIASLANQAANWLVAGHIPLRQGSEHPNIAPYGTVFKTKDNKEIVLAVGNDKQFQKLCEVLSIPEVANATEFAKNHDRVKNRIALNTYLAQYISQIERDDLLSNLSKKGVPAGAIRNMKEVFELRAAKEMLLNENTVKTVAFDSI